MAMDVALSPILSLPAGVRVVQGHITVFTSWPHGLKSCRKLYCDWSLYCLAYSCTSLHPDSVPERGSML